MFPLWRGHLTTDNTLTHWLDGRQFPHSHRHQGLVVCSADQVWKVDTGNGGQSMKGGEGEKWSRGCWRKEGKGKKEKEMGGIEIRQATR